MEEGESPETCLCRELNEELGIDVTESCLAPFTFASHFYGAKEGEGFHLLMMVYVCMRWKGIIRSREKQETRWVAVRDLKNYEMPPADIPLIARLRDMF